MNTLRNHFIKSLLISPEPVPPEPSLPEYYIQYTSNDGKIDLDHPDAFGSNIIGHYYDGEHNCYFIVFDGPIILIGLLAFWNADFTSIVIPESVTRIEENAFTICSKLTSITIPNSVTSIGKEAFEYCESLTSVTIPNSVTSIGWRTFGSCWALTSVVIGNSVTSIEQYAFEYCNSLTDITFQGTMAQWKGIDLNMFWKDGAPATVVHCTDGDVTL